MATMDLCTCKITLGGDNRQVVFRGPTRPMSYPEVNVMMSAHGERYVSDIKVIGQKETNNSEELQRLRIKYGEAAWTAFPGQRPRLPMLAPEDIPRDIEEAVADTVPAFMPDEGAEGEEVTPAKRRRRPKLE